MSEEQMLNQESLQKLAVAALNTRISVRQIKSATYTRENWDRAMQSLARDAWEKVEYEAKPDKEFEVEFKVVAYATVDICAKDLVDAVEKFESDVSEHFTPSDSLSDYDFEYQDVQACEV